MRPKIFGIGLPRTASRSVFAAVRRLGWERPRQDPVDWALITKAPASFDITIACRYRELDERYPGSKFILTLRPTVLWLLGIKKLYRRWAWRRKRGRAPRGSSVRRYRWWIGEAERMVWGTSWDRIPTGKEFLEGWMRHVAGVREYFKDHPEDLLEFDASAGDGYPKLCEFLGRPVPKRKFPYVKDLW